MPYLMPTSTDSSYIAIKLKVKELFHVAVILFYHARTHAHKKTENIYYHTQFQYPRTGAASVAPTSYVCQIT
jgi:hypothetical protein